MIQMKRFGGIQGVWTGVLAVALLGMAACSRSVDVPTEEGTAPTGQTPFHDDAPQPASDLADYYPSSNSRTASANSLPFQDSQSLPAGTLLIVRLQGPISITKSGVHEPFECSLDEAVLIDGNTVIPRGATVTGRVESARTSNLKPNRGYLRLALESVHMAGLDVPLQTASLFVRQSPQGDPSGTQVRLEKGRQLTFRLREPVFSSSRASTLAR